MRQTEEWKKFSHPQLFRYIKEEFIDSFFENGELGITTLRKCRKHERARRDESEGLLGYYYRSADKDGTAKLPNGILQIVDEQDNPVEKAEVLLARQLRDCYLLCMSSDDRLFQKFECQYAIRIYEPERFLKDVYAVLKDIIPLKNTGFGRVTYSNDRSMFNFTENVWNALFVKDLKFVSECEWRACFIPEKSANQIEPFKICCPNARRWCNKISLEQAR